MPTYRYECTKGHPWGEKIMTIAEMEVFEIALPKCPRCHAEVIRDYRTRRHLVFKEGFYEHISEDGAYVSSMADLRRIARDNGNYSEYAEDLGSAFGAKEGRWI